MIKSEFKKLFGDIKIEHCFASKGGSIFIELKDAESAKMIVKDWKETFFTGNGGGKTICNLLETIQNSVIVKEVPTHLEENEIATEIASHYPGAKVKHFIRSGNS